MANYYTYGLVPDVDETVYGTSVDYAGLGFPEYADRGLPEEEPVGPSPLSLAEEPVPADRPLPEEPYYGPSDEYNQPVTLPTRRDSSIAEAIQNLFVEGADVPQSTGVNVGALDELFANLRKTEELQKLALEPGLLQQGFTGTSGVTAPPSGAGIFATPTRAEEPAIDFNVTPEMAAALQQVARPAEITAAERATVQEAPRVQALQQISDQLQSNDFKGAFDTALKAEQQLGGDFVGNIVDPNKMRMLRDPMNAQEIAQFYTQMPEKVFEERYLGPGNEFKKEQAIERNVAALGGQEGYVDPMLGAKKEETLLSKLPVKELAALAAAAMGATAIPGLFGAGAGSGAGAGAAGSAGAAGGAGAAGAAGAGAGALTGVIPTGLIPGAVSAAGLGTATFPILASSGLTASQIAALGLGAAGAAGAATSGAGAPATAATTPTQPPLEEVVVTGSRAIDPALLRLVPGSLASTNLIQGATDVPTDIYGQPEAAPADYAGEYTISTGNPDIPFIAVPAAAAATSALSGTGAAPSTQVPADYAGEYTISTGNPDIPFIAVPAAVAATTALSSLGTSPTQVPADYAGEYVIEANRLQPIDVLAGTVPALGAQLINAGYQPPVFENIPLEEVVVKGSKPPVSPLDIAAIGAGGLTAAQLLQGFTKPSVDPLTGEPKEPPKTEQELDKIQDALKTGAPIPGTSSFLKDLIDKYGTLENAMKVLGALGSAFSGTKGATTPTAGTGTGGLGGALPKYTYTRQQLSPDIDYYTYGTRPEAKFFEQSLQLEKPTQPEGPPAKPPGEEPVMAMGGLTGYAKGGSKESRYVDGPGSGRDDKIPALLSDGEYVIDAETLALLGDGSTKEGARRMDEFRAKIRQHKGRALSRGQISPDAKSPEEYMGGGLV